MPDQVPECCDGPNEILRKILLQFISIGTNVPESVYPACCDGPLELYRKILLSFSYISGGATPIPPFVPTGTLAWYKSDTGITIDGGTGNVAAWADQSGNGYDVTNATGAQMFFVNNVINGFPALRGDGGDRSLQYIDFPTTGITEWTIIFVANSGAAQGPYEIVVGMRDPPDARWGFGVGNDVGTGSGWAGVASATAFPGQALAANTFYTRSYVKTTTEWNIFQNGNSIISAVADVSNPTDPLQFLVIGGESNLIPFQSGNNLNGDVVEVLIYSSALTGPQRGAVEGYLRNRYGHY